MVYTSEAGLFSRVELSLSTGRAIVSAQLRRPTMHDSTARRSCCAYTTRGVRLQRAEAAGRHAVVRRLGMCAGGRWQQQLRRAVVRAPGLYRGRRFPLDEPSDCIAGGHISWASHRAYVFLLEKK